MSTRVYGYVGPAELLALVGDGGGERIGSPGDFAAWVARRRPEERAEPFTFAVPVDGVLRLAPRRSEHVVCAAGGPVLAAGEIVFRGAYSAPSALAAVLTIRRLIP